MKTTHITKHIEEQLAFYPPKPKPINDILNTFNRLRDKVYYEIVSRNRFKLIYNDGKLSEVHCSGLKFKFILDYRNRIAVQINGSIDLGLKINEEKQIFKTITR